jgi:hypothetical protein
MRSGGLSHLHLGRKALELREFVRALHPSYSLRYLYVNPCRYGLWGIVRCIRRPCGDDL